MSDALKSVDYCLFPTRVGWILIAAGPAGICLLDFVGPVKPAEGALLGLVRRELPTIEKAVDRITPLLESAANRVRDYIDRAAPLPDLPLDLRKGTPFQREVWAALRRIPFGETRSYGQIAEAVGRPKGARAVGHACGRNPVPLFVPCHRVLGSGGGLGGFSSGLDVKRALLAIEKTRSRDEGGQPS